MVNFEIVWYILGLVIGSGNKRLDPSKLRIEETDDYVSVQD